MFKNFENFTYSSKENFPASVCTICNDIESGVLDASETYQVLYINIKFPKEKCIAYAKPYVYKDDESGETLFGWVCTHTSQIFGNVENSCQFYDEFVIGFLPVDDDFIAKDEALFEKLKSIIDAQYEEWLE